ncbi:hypothetical protein NEF87_000411 [Candidatus Lokiarchaeum ossiferum]|uniref:Actin, cytoplasmic 2 n=1 Tax=Candidatus Lokiarchaeum ossiferum TaxID=2951803 RepID=A0ABY6HKS1_9ARCH|nr:hypothetical protein NEF87_000411 [Candidatus Lokiarchaeum sp. B-35]
MENFYSVIIDMGQFSTKIGFGGENEPRYSFFTITGSPKYKTIGFDQKKQLFIGNEIIDSLGLYKVSSPIGKGGEIEDWDQFLSILDYIFYLLHVDPTLCKVMFTTNPFMSIESKRKLFEIFLEKINVAGYYPVRGALLTMYSGGFDTGLVVDMGSSNIRITPIYKSYVLQHAVKFLPLGGNVLDSFMSKKVHELGIPVDSSVQKNLIRVLKERACFCSLDFDNDLKNHANFQKDFVLPDSSTITIGSERFIVPELLFDPSLHNIECESLPQAIVNVAQSCDVDIRRELLQNIFITGGSSKFPLFEVKLKQEIETELNKMGKVAQMIRVIAPKGRTLSNWVGGSILSVIPEFQQSWMTRKRYYDEGVSDEMLNS